MYLLIIVTFLLFSAIEKVRERLHKEGHKLYTYVVDVTDRQNVYKNAELVKNEVGPVDILINNAGIVAGHTFLDIPDDMIEKTFQVNVISHYWVKSFSYLIVVHYNNVYNFYYYRQLKHFWVIC